MENKQIDFQDTKAAFAHKSNIELQKKRSLFKMMNSKSLVDLGTSLTNWALTLHLPVKTLIKNTIFKQFCGGETIEECEDTVKELASANIGAILDYSVEGRHEEEDFGETKKEILRTIDRAKSDDRIPFAVFKVSGIAPYGTLEKVSAGIELPEKSQMKWDRIQERVEKICKHAFDLNQPVFIDAEETWIQPAIDQMATAMMEKYNKERAIVFNTVQLYRHDRLEFLKRTHQEAKEKGYFYGIKLVRGAYMEKERERAAEKGYPSPIHETKEATDRDYDAAVEYCMQNLDTISFVQGTHNELSTQKLVELVNKQGVERNSPNVNFSQLYGMSDNLSYILAGNGFNVTKYVPYGPVRDALPYLIRRAQENTAMMGQMSRELEMIEKEIKRRKREGK